MSGKATYKTFKGGIHPPYNKELASGKSVRQAPVPAEVFIPLQQHIGAPNEPLVKAGDRVELGQKIGASEAFVSAPVHSSVAGTVKDITEITGFTGAKVKCVVIVPDAEQPEFAKQDRDVTALSDQEIRDIARDAGLVGMGGAAFPTHVKLTPPKEKPVDTVIINACECEPFLTCDHRLMLERPHDLVQGLKLLIRAVNARKGIIGIEANKMDAADAVRDAAKGESEVEVELLEVKYPEGAEKMLIFALTGRKVPPGKLPSEVGCLVQNVGTAVALYEAAAWGKPLYERVLTVTGPGIKEPANLLARVGTPISTLIEACGGFTGEPGKVIMGGPMTGWAQPDTRAPVVKGTSGVVVLTPEAVDVGTEEECVRCGKCVDVCPMFLLPNFIVQAVKKGQWDRAEMWGALDCFECGCCSYTCPAYIPHVDYVRKAKAEIAALKRR
ncbi:electron transport complex subunit RsxC [Candidatus Solincola tengchongensis]|uniref:electron transport complex subunit RsxC n=1 Tax=Candidatus Solincola tengchongensis TaxID=2900693 RepID=UPI002580C469|nr:electron transport complex subunit RsxC [Candidatus Solincola tengchongensis]